MMMTRHGSKSKASLSISPVQVGILIIGLCLFGVLLGFSWIKQVSQGMGHGRQQQETMSKADQAGGGGR